MTPKHPRVGMDNQRFTPGGGRRDDDVIRGYAPLGCVVRQPTQGYTAQRYSCSCCDYGYYCNPALRTQMHPLQVNGIFQTVRRCYACKQRGHIAKFCPSVRHIVPTSEPPSTPVLSRCCLSVLMATVTAPSTPRWVMRLRVLLPEPPQTVIGSMHLTGGCLRV